MTRVGWAWRAIGGPSHHGAGNVREYVIEAEGGITPTGVGSTRQGHAHPPGALAHPHGRGEHVNDYATVDVDCGPPPTGVGSTG